MAQDFSFDVVSQPDINEVKNGVNMAMKEIINRFDFKGSNTEITLGEAEITVVTDSDMHLKNAISVLEGKMVKRSVALGFFEHQKVEDSLGGTLKQQLIIKQGISVEKAKEINKAIKEQGLKVKTQIQDDKIRVSSAKKDLLQDAIQFLKGQDFGIVLNFENYR